MQKITNKTSNLFLALISIVPSILLITISLFEPVLYNMGLDDHLISEVAQFIRLISGLMIIGMMLYFIYYVLTSDDNRISSKKGLWIAVLLIGNIFAVPFFCVFLLTSRKLA
jgi:Na+-driven multidrug efflux pump